MIRVARWGVLLTLVGMFFFGLFIGAEASARPIRGTVDDGWIRYRKVEGPDESPYVLIVKARCLAEEDSAAHLKLLNYDPEKIVLGCYHHGY